MRSPPPASRIDAFSLYTILDQIWQGATGAPLLDQANLALGIAGVWLMIRRSLWAFPVGLVAVSVQAVLFWQARFYADAKLQGFFFVLLVYGWIHWVRAKGAAPELPVTTQAPRWRVLTLGAGGLAWLVWAQLNGAAQQPYRDAFIAAFSIVAQWLQARKRIENWPLWIVVNGVAVWSYWMAAIYYTAFLYAIYLILAIGGWREWARALPARTPHRGSDHD